MEETKELRIQALNETARAFARKQEAIQYESTPMSYQGYYGERSVRRRTDGFAPEEATRDSFRFTVCSSFIYNLLYNTFGYKLCGDDYAHYCHAILDNYKDNIVYAYDPDVNPEAKFKASIREAMAAWTPGRIMVIEHKARPLMHVMYQIPGGSIIHSAGGKINMETGEEKWEHFGSVRQEDNEKFFLSVFGFSFWEYKKWWVIDILDAIDPEKYPMTPSAHSRVKFPGLDIDRTAVPTRYRSVYPGEIMTVTLRLTNTNPPKSKVDLENIPVTEVVPENTTLLWDSLDCDAVSDGKTIRWNVTLKDTQVKTLTYQVRINDNVKPGTVICSGGGLVDQIPSNTICRAVGCKPLSNTEIAALAALNSEKAAAITGDAPQWVYTSLLKKTVKLPTLQDILAAYDYGPCPYDEDDTQEVKDAAMSHRLLHRKSEALTEAEKFIAPELIGGKCISDLWWNQRVLELRSTQLQAGDVILSATGLTETTCSGKSMTVLGGGKVLTQDGDGIRVEDMPVLDTLLVTDFFAVLRPSNIQ